MGLPARFARVGPLRSSQVCSALQAFSLCFKSLGSAACGGPATAPQPIGG
ncbi:hypothetical protein SGRA_3194 [Saprospira grandis str. Lewin]|uniref:Uncharacterized protein n=1 Tax=Saprospira grandis (strain Lewin) TaxID=984262 RepID=H6L0W6_SAPGL|nr:hypothetical protein SGRA_3194 [Saprospira grandis str. Lewin]